MTKFTGATGLPTIELTVGDNSQSHTTANSYCQEVIHPLPRTKPSFRQGQGVNIIFNIHRDVELALKHLLERHIIPAIDRGLPQDAMFCIDNAGQTDADSQELLFRDLLSTDK